jgi:predicted kinase
LANSMPAIRLNKDDWVRQLGHDVWDDEFRRRIEAQLWDLAQKLLKHGTSVILEWGHWARAELDQKRLGARSLGVGVELHFVDVPLGELIDRVERRQRSGEWTASPISREQMRVWETTFEPPHEDERRLYDPPLHAGLT